MTYIKNGSANLDVGSRASPVAVDWNRDSKKDLLIGETYGNIFYFENRGTDADPVFSGSILLNAGGSAIDVGYYPRFDAVDWDNDGVLDILCGYYDYYASTIAGVYYFHAKGPLSIDKNTISASLGGTINFTFKAGAAFAGRLYGMTGSASGTEPGTPLPGGEVLPLNRDLVFEFIRNNFGSPMFTGFIGTLDPNGQGTAVLDTMGAIPAILPPGSTLNFAYTTAFPCDYQSNAVSVEVLP
jgi:hypothetical protein